MNQSLYAFLVVAIIAVVTAFLRFLPFFTVNTWTLDEIVSIISPFFVIDSWPLLFGFWVVDNAKFLLEATIITSESTVKSEIFLTKFQVTISSSVLFLSTSLNILAYIMTLFLSQVNLFLLIFLCFPNKTLKKQGKGA